MSDRDRSDARKRGASGARPFAPGEAPLGVRPGLAGQRRRAGADAGARILTRREPPAAASPRRGGDRSRLRPETWALLRRFALVALLATAFVVPPALAVSGRVTVTSVRILGLELLDERAVSDLVGVAVGSSLLSADLQAVERALMETPFIASARARIGLPGEVRIEVREEPLLLRWKRADDTFLVSGSGELLGSTASPLLRASSIAAIEALPLVDDRTSEPALMIGSQLPALSLDIATRLATLTLVDLASEALRLSILRDPQYGFVLHGVGKGISWYAVFGTYSATIRPPEMLPGQVRLLRSLLAVRERSIGWVILADGQAGTFTDPGVRPPPPPSREPSPSLP